MRRPIAIVRPATIAALLDVVVVVVVAVVVDAVAVVLGKKKIPTAVFSGVPVSFVFVERVGINFRSSVFFSPLGARPPQSLVSSFLCLFFHFLFCFEMPTS